MHASDLSFMHSKEMSSEKCDYCIKNFQPLLVPSKYVTISRKTSHIAIYEFSSTKCIALKLD